MTRKEYNKCVDETADALYSFSLKLCRHRQEAQDIVQQSYEKLWKKHENVDKKTAGAWLYTTARRTMIDSYRRKKTEAKILDIEMNSSVVEPADIALKDLLNQALNTLNHEQKQLIMLRDYEGYAYKEIADIMDLSLSQVKVYIFRARKLLRDWITMNEKKTYNVIN